MVKPGDSGEDGWGSQGETSLFEVWPPSVAFGAYNQHSNLSRSAHCTTFLRPAPLPLSITPRPWNDNQYDSTSIAVTPLHTQHQHHHRQWLGQRTRCGLTRPRWSTAPWSCTGWAPGAYWCRWRRASARPSSSRTFLRYAHALKVRFLPAVVRGVYFCVYMQVDVVARGDAPVCGRSFFSGFAAVYCTHVVLCLRRPDPNLGMSSQVSEVQCAFIYWYFAPRQMALSNGSQIDWFLGLSRNELVDSLALFFVHSPG